MRLGLLGRNYDFPRTCGGAPLLEGYGRDNPAFSPQRGDVPGDMHAALEYAALSPHLRG